MATSISSPTCACRLIIWRTICSAICECSMVEYSLLLLAFMVESSELYRFANSWRDRRTPGVPAQQNAVPPPINTGHYDYYFFLFYSPHSGFLFYYIYFFFYFSIKAFAGNNVAAFINLSFVTCLYLSLVSLLHSTPPPWDPLGRRRLVSGGWLGWTLVGNAEPLTFTTHTPRALTTTDALFLVNKLKAKQKRIFQ